MPYRPIWKNHKVVKGEDGFNYLEERSPFFKEIFRAEPGYELIYADYSQLEINILANLITLVGSKDRSLQEAIRAGKDVHSYTASLVYSIIMNKKYEESFITANKHLEPYKTWRQDCKSVIFKLIYGGTHKSMAREKNIPEENAKFIWDTFLNTIFGIKDYMEYEKAFGANNKYVQTIAGHSRDVKILGIERWNNKAKNICLNHPIQGSASYLVNLAMIKLHELIGTLGGNILLTVHDSIVSQIPKHKLHEGLLLKLDVMENYLTFVKKDFFDVPPRIDLETGSNWNNVKQVDIKNLREELKNGKSRFL